MRKIIEWCYVSADGVFEDPIRMGVGNYQDEAYLRDSICRFFPSLWATASHSSGRGKL
jgi:hypothetical protein